MLVAGGGSAGSAAATAAAREGARTLLVEAAGFLGGTGAAVLDTFYGFYAPGGDARVVGGIGWELCERLLGSGQAFERPNTYGAGTGVTYEPEALKFAWDELVGGAGARVLHHARLIAVVTDGRRVHGAILETRAGPRRVSATSFVDATGDAELAWRAGAAVDRPGDENRVQPLTATFRLGGVDPGRTPTKELHRLMAEAADAGDYVLPRREGSSHRTVLDGVVHTNLTRVARRRCDGPLAADARRAGGPPAGAGVRPLPRRPRPRLRGRVPARQLRVDRRARDAAAPRPPRAHPRGRARGPRLPRRDRPLRRPGGGPRGRRDDAAGSTSARTAGRPGRPTASPSAACARWTSTTSWSRAAASPRRTTPTRPRAPWASAWRWARPRAPRRRSRPHGGDDATGVDAGALRERLAARGVIL